MALGQQPGGVVQGDAPFAGEGGEEAEMLCPFAIAGAFELPGGHPLGKPGNFGGVGALQGDAVCIA